MGNSCFQPDDLITDEVYEVHPLSHLTVKFKDLSDWIWMPDCECAMRISKGDNPARYGSRVAYIEKTARVLIDNNDNWESVNKSSDRGMSQDSLAACDLKLIELGYELESE